MTEGAVTEGADLESDLLDLSGVDLHQLDALPDSVLVTSLRRVLRENDELPDQYAVFQNSM